MKKRRKYLFNSWVHARCRLDHQGAKEKKRTLKQRQLHSPTKKNIKVESWEGNSINDLSLLYFDIYFKGKE